MNDHNARLGRPHATPTATQSIWASDTLPDDLTASVTEAAVVLVFALSRQARTCQRVENAPLMLSLLLSFLILILLVYDVYLLVG